MAVRQQSNHNRSSNNHHQSNNRSPIIQHPSSTHNNIRNRNGHHPPHPNARQLPPLQTLSPINTNNNSNTNTNNRRTKKPRKNALWKYLEARKGLHCILTAPTTAHGTRIDIGTIAVVEQDNADTMPYLSFAKPFANHRCSTNVKKDQLSFS